MAALRLFLGITGFAIFGAGIDFFDVWLHFWFITWLWWIQSNKRFVLHH